MQTTPGSVGQLMRNALRESVLNAGRLEDVGFADEHQRLTTHAKFLDFIDALTLLMLAGSADTTQCLEEVTVDHLTSKEALDYLAQCSTPEVVALWMQLVEKPKTEVKAALTALLEEGRNPFAQIVQAKASALTYQGLRDYVEAGDTADSELDEVEKVDEKAQGLAPPADISAAPVTRATDQTAVSSLTKKLKLLEQTEGLTNQLTCFFTPVSADLKLANDQTIEKDFAKKIAQVLIKDMMPRANGQQYAVAVDSNAVKGLVQSALEKSSLEPYQASLTALIEQFKKNELLATNVADAVTRTIPAIINLGSPQNSQAGSPPRTSRAPSPVGSDTSTAAPAATVETATAVPTYGLREQQFFVGDDADDLTRAREQLARKVYTGLIDSPYPYLSVTLGEIPTSQAMHQLFGKNFTEVEQRASDLANLIAEVVLPDSGTINYKPKSLGVLLENAVKNTAADDNERLTPLQPLIKQVCNAYTRLDTTPLYTALEKAVVAQVNALATEKAERVRAEQLHAYQAPALPPDVPKISDSHVALVEYEVKTALEEAADAFLLVDRTPQVQALLAKTFATELVRLAVQVPPVLDMASRQKALRDAVSGTPPLVAPMEVITKAMAASSWNMFVNKKLSTSLQRIIQSADASLAKTQSVARYLTDIAREPARLLVLSDSEVAALARVLPSLENIQDSTLEQALAQFKVEVDKIEAAVLAAIARTAATSTAANGDAINTYRTLELYYALSTLRRHLAYDESMRKTLQQHIENGRVAENEVEAFLLSIQELAPSETVVETTDTTDTTTRKRVREERPDGLLDDDHSSQASDSGHPSLNEGPTTPLLVRHAGVNSSGVADNDAAVIKDLQNRASWRELRNASLITLAVGSVVTFGALWLTSLYVSGFAAGIASAFGLTSLSVSGAVAATTATVATIGASAATGGILAAVIIAAVVLIGVTALLAAYVHHHHTLKRTSDPLEVQEFPSSPPSGSGLAFGSTANYHSAGWQRSPARGASTRPAAQIEPTGPAVAQRR